MEVLPPGESLWLFLRGEDGSSEHSKRFFMEDRFGESQFIFFADRVRKRPGVPMDLEAKGSS